MPFKKVGKDKNVSPSEVFTDAQEGCTRHRWLRLKAQRKRRRKTEVSVSSRTQYSEQTVKRIPLRTKTAMRLKMSVAQYDSW